MSEKKKQLTAVIVEAISSKVEGLEEKGAKKLKKSIKKAAEKIAEKYIKQEKKAEKKTKKEVKKAEKIALKPQKLKTQTTKTDNAE